MKRILYIVLFVMLSCLLASAQTTDGLWLTSRQRVSATNSGIYIGQSSGMSSAASVNPSTSFTTGTGSAAFSSGSRYSAQLSAVGASSVNMANPSVRHRREGENPFDGKTVEDYENPQEPGTPLGDVPFLFMLLLLTMYLCVGRRLKQVHRAK